MSTPGEDYPSARKPRRFGWLLLLLLLLFGAAYYLSSKGGFDWYGQYAQLKDRLFKQTQPPPPKEKAAMQPTFDVVRAEPTGEVVMAGRSEPGWNVSIENKGQPIGTVKADENGEWVYQPDNPLPPGEHSLSLRATSEDGQKTSQGSQRIALSITGKPKDQPIIAMTEQGKPTKLLEQAAPQAPARDRQEEKAGKPAAAPAEDERKPEKAAAAPAKEAQKAEKSASAPPAKAETAAPLVPGKPSVQEDKNKPPAHEEKKSLAEGKPEPGKISQAETPKPPHPPQSGSLAGKGEIAGAAVSFSTVDFEKQGSSGMIYMTGKASPNARVMLYINNAFVGMAVAGADGSWTFSGARDLPPGSHQIRADQVEEGSGKVLARAEVSFEQTKPEEVAKPEAAPPLQPESRAVSKTPAPQLQKPETATAQVAVPRGIAPGAGSSGTEAPSAKAVAVQERPRKEAAAPPRRRKKLARGGCRFVSVRRGDTLWSIAERCYGDGERFTKIFRSNKDQIRDPDLIYPDQKFVVPR